MRILCLFLLALVAPPALSGSPIGEVICSPTADMTERLTQRLQSARVASGLRNPEEVVEVWADAAGDWTMVIRYSSGQSCIVAMGDYWQESGT
ncbi:hypothetical protein ACN2XU_19890 [Primorskyibacter sp. 2E107]|uniref:hypothetical protein n=1 Tax=Primorskyibacter sp. 2E107 TaxID=3403458 RepID=UPI003AF69BCC